MNNNMLVGYKGRNSIHGNSDYFKNRVRLDYLMIKHDNFTLSTENLWLDYQKDICIRAYLNDILIREWVWNSNEINCFFEDVQGILIGESLIKSLISGNEVPDSGFFYAPYMPIYPYQIDVARIKKAIESTMADPGILDGY